MSVIPFLLDGWHEQSTWGDDDGSFYAQLTRDGRLARDVPELWITPGSRNRACDTAPELAVVVSAALSLDVASVLQAMSNGIALVAGDSATRTCAALGLPKPPQTPALVAPQPSTSAGSASTSVSSS